MRYVLLLLATLAAAEVATPIVPFGASLAHADAREGGR
jgi:hypothetical protein